MNIKRSGKYITYFALLTFALVSCTSAATATATPAISVMPSITPMPAKTSTPTATPIPSPTPTIKPPFDIPITDNNADQLFQLSSWGNTSTSVTMSAAQGNTMILQTPFGTSFISTENNEQIAFVENTVIFSISDDGNLIATGQVDGTVDIWDAATGQLVKSLTEQKKTYRKIVPVRSLAFSHNGQKIAAGFSDGQIAIWKINESGEPIKFRGGDTPLYKIEFSPTDKYLFSLSFQIWLHELNEDGATTLWKMNYEKEVPGYWPFLAGFSTNEETIALIEISGFGFMAGSMGSWVPVSKCQLLMLQMEDGKLIKRNGIEKCSDPRMSFSDNGLFLYVDLPELKKRQIRDASNGAILTSESKYEFERSLSSEYNYLLQGYDTFGPVVYEITQGIKGAILNPDKSITVWGTTGDTVYWWTESNGIVKAYPQKNERVYFSPNGELAVYCNNRQMEILYLNGQTKDIAIPEYPQCEGIAISPTSDTLTVWSGRRLALVSISTGSIQNITGYQHSIGAVTYSADGKLLAVQTDNIIVYQVNPIKKISQAPIRFNFYGFGLSQDGTMLAIQDGHYKDPLKIYKIPEATILGEVPIETQVFQGFSPDEKLIVTVEKQKAMVTLWALSDNGKAADLTGHQVLHGGPVLNNIVFSSFPENGRGILTVGIDGTVRLWGIDPNPHPIDLLTLFPSGDITTGDGWSNDDRGPIKLNSPFSLTINMEGHGEFPSLTISGRIWKEGEWWKGINRIFVIIDGNRIRFSIRDGKSENSVIDFTLPSAIKPGKPFLIKFLDAKGKVFQIYDSQNTLVQEYDVTKLTRVDLPDGLFPDGLFYPGYFMSPKAELHINMFTMLEENP